MVSGFESVGRDSVEREDTRAVAGCQWTRVNETHIEEMKCNIKIEGTSNRNPDCFLSNWPTGLWESKSYIMIANWIWWEAKAQFKDRQTELSSDSGRKREWSKGDITKGIKRFDKCIVLINELRRTDIVLLSEWGLLKRLRKFRGIQESARIEN